MSVIYWNRIKTFFNLNKNAQKKAPRKSGTKHGSAWCSNIKDSTEKKKREILKEWRKNNTQLFVSILQWAMGRCTMYVFLCMVFEYGYGYKKPSSICSVLK